MDWIKIEGECMLPNDDTCLYQVRHQDGQIPFDRMITLSEVRPLYLAKIITDYRIVKPCKELFFKISRRL